MINGSQPHSSQILILRHLLFTDMAAFAELQKATSLESDLFNFHLKKLVLSELVFKNSSGSYELTPAGKSFANRMDTDLYSFNEQAKLSVVIVIEDETGRQLYQERLKQPYFGYWGHPTTKVHFGETLLEAAERGLYDKTKLRAELRIVGVFHKLDHDKTTNQLLEDKYLYLVHGTSPTDTLLVDTEGHHNEWLTDSEVSVKDKVFGSPEETSSVLCEPGQFIIEKHYYYPLNEY